MSSRDWLIVFWTAAAVCLFYFAVQAYVGFQRLPAFIGGIAFAAVAGLICGKAISRKRG